MTTPTVQYLKDYQAPLYTVKTVELTVDLYADYAEVSNTMRIVRTAQQAERVLPELVLDGEQQELISVALNGQVLSPAQYQLSAERLVLHPNLVKSEESGFSDPLHPRSGRGQAPNPPPLGGREPHGEFTVTVVSRNHPKANTALEGLYQSNDILCTQCEPHGFRRITYFPDRPDIMALFTTTIRADKTAYPTLLSNGNCIAQQELPNNRHSVIWVDPIPKSSYLFALVAGQLSKRHSTFTTQSGRTVALEIFTRPADAAQSEYALEALKDAMRWDETTYGREYDLDVYMIVAIHDFNMGAMENKGLNIFNSQYVLSSPQTATDTDYRQVQAVIGHEYFHNWTGNRVTCRDWFQLSLKEGLTVFRDEQFTADHHSETVKRIDDTKRIRSSQFAEDASPMAHPIRPASYIEMNNFYTVTVYQKGAEVIRMLHTLTGKAGFRKGMDLYFARHDGQAVTCDDFVAAIADANHLDLTQFKRWYSQAGTPTLHIQDHYDPQQKSYTVTVQQTCPATADHSAKEPFVIPLKMALVGAQGQDLRVEHDGRHQSEWLLLVTEPEQTYRFHEVAEAPIPSLLRDFSAPVKLDYAYTDSQLQHLLSYDSNEFNRWDAGQKLMTRWLLAAISASHQQHALPDVQPLLQALSQTLHNTALDDALIAEILSVPSETTLAQDLSTIWVEAIYHARTHLLDAIAHTLKPQLLAHYHRCHTHGEYRRDKRSIATRRLKNVCLSYLARLNEPAITHLAETQFQHANNMTDQLAALAALVNGHSDVARTTALERFYQQWQQESLVVNKWLMIQATAQHPNVIQTVQQLLTHPAFSLHTPNKVYALLGGFAANHYYFHRNDGAGYQLLAEQIKRLNGNPQVAARLVRNLMDFRRYDSNRQALMRQALESVASLPGLARDVFEIVSKSLNF